MPVKNGVNIAIYTVGILRVGQNEKTVLIRSGIPDSFSSFLAPHCCGHVSFEAFRRWPLYGGDRKELRPGLVALLLRLRMRRTDRNSHPLGNDDLGDFINTKLLAECGDRVHKASARVLKSWMQVRRRQDQHRSLKVLSHLVRQRRRCLRPGLLRLLRRSVWLVLRGNRPFRVEVLAARHFAGLPQRQLAVAAGMLQPLEVGLLGVRVITGSLDHIGVFGIAINVTLQQILKWPHCSLECASIQPVALATCSGCKHTSFSGFTPQQRNFPKKVASPILLNHNLPLLPTNGGRCGALLHDEHFVVALSLINDSFTISERFHFQYSSNLGNLVAAQCMEELAFLQKVAAALKVLHANIHDQSLKAVTIQSKHLGIFLRNDRGRARGLIQHGQLPE
mmetsp:Transcript_86422/g.231506  ORF Transcript_86422/g.231506 Transcript_86422/m.231506 type:complete len:393 (+) Transcript_86422:917-2095(+)